MHTRLRSASQRALIDRLKLFLCGHGGLSIAPEREYQAIDATRATVQAAKNDAQLRRRQAQQFRVGLSLNRLPEERFFTAWACFDHGPVRT